MRHLSFALPLQCNQVYTDSQCWRSAGWGFFDAADVVDPDQEDGGEVYNFDLSDEVGVHWHLKLSCTEADGTCRQAAPVLHDCLRHPRAFCRRCARGPEGIQRAARLNPESDDM